MKLLLCPLASITNLAFIFRPEKQITSDILFFSEISLAVSLNHSIPLHFLKVHFERLLDLLNHNRSCVLWIIPFYFPHFQKN